MKKRLKVTVDRKMIAAAKAYSNQQKISLSKLVESYFISLIQQIFRIALSFQNY